MASNGKDSHKAIWDDSALVDSWNDAVEEYKKYHSIKARGENINEVLKATEDERNKTGGKMDYGEGEFEEPPVNDPRAKKDLQEEKIHLDAGPAENDARVEDRQAEANQAPNRTPPALPQHLIGQGHDEGLKNLLMSWYYAGYYTGLYEGQQQGQGKHEG